MINNWNIWKNRTPSLGLKLLNHCIWDIKSTIKQKIKCNYRNGQLIYSRVTSHPLWVRGGVSGLRKSPQFHTGSKWKVRFKSGLSGSNPNHKQLLKTFASFLIFFSSSSVSLSLANSLKSTQGVKALSLPPSTSIAALVPIVCSFDLLLPFSNGLFLCLLFLFRSVHSMPCVELPLPSIKVSLFTIFWIRLRIWINPISLSYLEKHLTVQITKISLIFFCSLQKINKFGDSWSSPGIIWKTDWM